MSPAVIAIDGPAASGKSSVARLLARKLGCLYVNSGSFYRGVTWWVMQQEKADPAATPQSVAGTLRMEVCEPDQPGQEAGLRINGEDPSNHVRDREVNANVSRVAADPEVRRVITDLLRTLGDGRALVMEGRDIGSVVFPDTPYKFYIDADEEIRAQRRAAQGEMDSIAGRDKQDSQRKTAPLIISEDAHVIDSSHLTLEGVVGEVIGRLRHKGLDVEL